MKIMKIFSSQGGEERLYSVLLTESEIALLSQREFGKGDTKGRAKKEAERRKRQKALRQEQIQKGREAKAVVNNIPAPKPTPVVTSAAKETVKKEVSQATKKEGKNLLSKALQTVKNNKKAAIAIGAGALTAGTGLAISKSLKDKEE